jgi:glutamyl-tRNA synthetase
MVTVRTRIAPSPTGNDLHIGNAYTALINSVVARKAGGQFIIRVEDTDRTRLVVGSENRILQSLKWLDIPYDEGPDIGGPYAPYRQSERLASYKQYAEELIEKGYAYYCFCTSDRLSHMRKDQEIHHKPPMYDGLCKTLDKKESKKRATAGEAHVVRMNVPDTGVTTFTDLIRGEISFENELIDDQVILKSDGYPTYHLGVVVDDHLMKISHIIRGEEWIPSTPKHILLYKFFGWDIPTIAHVSVLRNPDRSKLSKRKNPVWVSDYQKKGYLPEAIRNYLSSMAWSYPDGRDVFSTEEMTGVFDISQIKTSAPIFDVEKLRWMNGEYIRKAEISNFKYQISNFYQGKYNTDMIEKIWPLVRDRMKTLAEFESLANFFFERPKTFERSQLDKPASPAGGLVKLVKFALSNCLWTHDHMEKAIRDIADKEGLKAKDLFMELRIAVTGKTVGPPLLESLEVLGKEETLSRLSSRT